jgi:hypothetical protein
MGMGMEMYMDGSGTSGHGAKLFSAAVGYQPSSFLFFFLFFPTPTEYGT